MARTQDVGKCVVLLSTNNGSASRRSRGGCHHVRTVRINNNMCLLFLQQGKDRSLPQRRLLLKHGWCFEWMLRHLVPLSQGAVKSIRVTIVSPPARIRIFIFSRTQDREKAPEKVRSTARQRCQRGTIGSTRGSQTPERAIMLPETKQISVVLLRRSPSAPVQSTL